MHLIIKRDCLSKIKAHIQLISNGSKTENILIRTDKNTLIFFSIINNCLIRREFRSERSLSIKKEGKVCINLKILGELMNRIDTKHDLEIYRAEKNYLQFFSGPSYECDLILSSVNEMEEENFFNGPQEKSIPFPMDILRRSYTRLKDFCKRIENSVSSNSVLTNIHFKKDSESSVLEVCASDSYRFVCGEFEFDNDSEFRINLFPTILFLILGLYEDQESVDFYLVEGGNFLVCGQSDCSIKIRLDNTNYPSFFHWFHLSEGISFSIEKNHLMEMIDRNLFLLSNDDIKSTLYRVEKNKLSIIYSNNERGRCKETIDIKNEKKEGIEFCLNNFLLKTLIKPISSDEIVFRVYDSLKPIVLLSTSENSRFKQFILPLKNV